LRRSQYGASPSRQVRRQKVRGSSFRLDTSNLTPSSNPFFRRFRARIPGRALTTGHVRRLISARPPPMVTNQQEFSDKNPFRRHRRTGFRRASVPARLRLARSQSDRLRTNAQTHQTMQPEPTVPRRSSVSTRNVIRFLIRTSIVPPDSFADASPWRVVTMIRRLWQILLFFTCILPVG
jgi:hypothetical protein